MERRGRAAVNGLDLEEAAILVPSASKALESHAKKVAIGMNSRGDCGCRGPAVSNLCRLSDNQSATKGGSNDLLLASLSFRIFVNHLPSVLYSSGLSHILLNVRHTYEGLQGRRKAQASMRLVNGADFSDAKVMVNEKVNGEIHFD